MSEIKQASLVNLSTKTLVLGILIVDQTKDGYMGSQVCESPWGSWHSEALMFLTVTGCSSSTAAIVLFPPSTPNPLGLIG